MNTILFKTTEGRVLLTGIVFSMLLLGTIAYYAVTDFGMARTLFLTFFANVFGGRSVGIGLCIIEGFGPAPSIFYNFFLEVLVVCFTYPLFILTTTNYVRVEWITRIMVRISGSALRHKGRIERFGGIGIFLFVMFPLAVTGPVVGSIIGYMIGISLFKNFSASFLGTLSAITLWYFGFEFLEERFQMIQYVFAAILALVAIRYYPAIRRFVLLILDKKRQG